MKEIIDIIIEQIPNWIMLQEVVGSIIDLVSIPMIGIPIWVTFGIWLYKKLKKRKRF